jgi:hypothetical protein
VAIAGVVVVEAGGGGEVRRVGSSGGEGANISLGGGGAIMICSLGSCFGVEEKTYLMREVTLLLSSHERRYSCFVGITECQDP